MSSMRGIFWFDPGVSTGIAWGIFDVKSHTAADAMRDKLVSGSATVATKGYTPADMVYHSREIWRYWSSFKRECTRRFLEPDQIVLGAENFVLHTMHSKGIQGIFPAYVIGAFEGYRHGLYDNYHPRQARHLTPLVLQMAGDASRYNTQKFLKAWDCWVVGREHERTAFAHIGAYMMRHLS